MTKKHPKAQKDAAAEQQNDRRWGFAKRQAARRDELRDMHPDDPRRAKIVKDIADDHVMQAESDKAFDERHGDK